MTPVFQTEHYGGRDWRERGRVPGNCAQAAVASLFDLPLAEVPHFAAEVDPGPSDYRAMREWARARGLDFTWADPADPEHAGYLETMRAECARAGERYVLASVAVLGVPAVHYGQHMVVWDLVEERIAHNPTRGANPAMMGPVTAYYWPCEPYEPDPLAQYKRAQERPAA